MLFSGEMSRVLLVDDDPSMRELLEATLSARGLEVVSKSSAEEALAAMRAGQFESVVTDLNMQGMNGLELCERLSVNFPDLPVIVITAKGSMEAAVGALRARAYDFLTKPIDSDGLAATIERAVKGRAANVQLNRLMSGAEGPSPMHAELEGIVGESPQMREVMEVLASVADLDVPVLITGESGTGKELVARALHRKSKHRRGAFVATNCAAMPATLLEAELFGVVKGAFTDAKTDRQGLFARATSGTLFLDEIGELEIALQPKLLRALAERIVMPLGGDKEVPFDARIVAATNKDLREAVEDGAFREDLLYRLNVVEIKLPPLRERGADILLYAYHFLRQSAESMGRPVEAISSAAAEKLLSYSWPGNLRQLKNCIERAVALTKHAHIVVDDLPEHVRTCVHTSTASVESALMQSQLSSMITLDELVGRYIARVTEAAGGNKTLAAKVLGVNRRTLYRRRDREAADTHPLPDTE